MWNLHSILHYTRVCLSSGSQFEMANIKERVLIFVLNFGNTVLQRGFGDEGLSCAKVFWYFSKFNVSQTSDENDEWGGRPPINIQEWCNNHLHMWCGSCHTIWQFMSLPTKSAYHRVHISHYLWWFGYA